MMDTQPAASHVDVVEQTTIITCIEAGGLEDEVVLLARSLRQLGGKYADTPIVAIKARNGPAIRRSTRHALDQLAVTFVEQPLNFRTAWWAHANKPAALTWAQSHATTPWVTWMDSDMLVLQEPDAFAPPAGYDFIARPGEATDVASSGSDEKAPFWHAVCAQQQLDFDSFPTVVSFPDHKQIRAYWQAGIYTYARSSKLADAYARIMHDLLNGSIGSKFAGVYHTDQVALALAVQAAGMTSAEYAPTMNLNLNVHNPEPFGRYPVEQVDIVHYHGSFWPADADWALRQLGSLTDTQRAVMDGLVPISSGSAFVRLQRQAYAMLRSPAMKAYKGRAQPI
jgi:hypothetical protein